MTNTCNPTDTEIDIHGLLAQRRQVAIIWSFEDVQELRPDLDDAQAWKVLRECKRRHDCEIGFTWTFIQCVAETLFPENS